MMEILEWFCFLGSLVSVWLYGKNTEFGPITGAIISISFILFGFLSGILAAAITNFIFLYLHVKNLLVFRKKNMVRFKKKIKDNFQFIQEQAHKASVDAGWWSDIRTGEKLPVDVPLKLCLIHSEISEAMEGDRKNLMDDKLPHRKAIEVELADAVIRIADLAGALSLDLGGAIAEKMEFNRNRPDHKLENRKKETGGKRY